MEQLLLRLLSLRAANGIRLMKRNFRGKWDKLVTAVNSTLDAADSLVSSSGSGHIILRKNIKVNQIDFCVQVLAAVILQYQVNS